MHPSNGSQQTVPREWTFFPPRIPPSNQFRTSATHISNPSSKDSSTTEPRVQTSSQSPTFLETFTEAYIRGASVRVPTPPYSTQLLHAPRVTASNRTSLTRLSRFGHDMLLQEAECTTLISTREYAHNSILNATSRKNEIIWPWIAKGMHPTKRSHFYQVFPRHNESHTSKHRPDFSPIHETKQSKTTTAIHESRATGT
ncbi:hypothetical protein BJ508DRAFT_351215 [Ascobolus immersus RN42]|uniref:Uncharacterized protein n=1 Tax=Ascobolus immersus RN42 TaxID=1160509 RepID=A0A3N4HSV6_ASCIM|nr:hypothetical protein BJ508DRAFT_351215 [Ascobolus immersus RN42]